MDLVTEREHFRNRLSELRDVARIGSPWIFVCASAYVEYLARLEKGAVTNGPDYIEFVKRWFVKINPTYGAFRFKSGTQDLPEQMYSVLRCGVVHSLSLVPDPASKGGRPRPIALAHHENAARSGLRHLDPYCTKEISDAALFVAEDFVTDLCAVTELLLARLRKV